jgi:metacaspase-1
MIKHRKQSAPIPSHLLTMIRQDANIAGQATGAMSWAFITALKKNPQQSYLSLLNNIREELSTKYTQKPQLSCSHPLGR